MPERDWPTLRLAMGLGAFGIPEGDPVGEKNKADENADWGPEEEIDVVSVSLAELGKQVYQV